MPRLAIHRDAADDLQSIRARGEHADHGAILAFLQQAKVDPALLATLAEDWFGEDGSAHHTVRKIVSLHQRGKRVWRVKEIAYDQTHPRIQRLLHVYDNLDLA